MKRVSSVIRREILAPALLTLLVLTFVVFARQFGRWAELLLSRGASWSTIAEVVVSLLPSVLIFTVPFSVLIGTLIGFSRLSAESEIVALRAGGISAGQMLVPSLQLGAVACLLTGVMTFTALPMGAWNLRLLQQEAGVTPLQSQVRPRVFYEELPGIILYVEDIDPQTNTWKGIFLADSSQDRNRVVVARRGRTVADSRRLQLSLESGMIYTVPTEAVEKDAISRFATHDFVVELPETGSPLPSRKRPTERSLQDIQDDLRSGSEDDRRSSVVELNRRLALTLAPILFAVVGVTFGLRSHQGGRGYGFMLGVAMAFTYYVLLAAGSTLSRDGKLPVSVGVWGANLLIVIVAVWSVRRADSALGGMFALPRWQLLERPRGWLRRLSGWLYGMTQRASSRWERLTSSVPRRELRLARVLDLYMTRTFLLYLAATLSMTIALYYLFTLFDLIDDLFRNGIGLGVLLNYFFYLLPHMLMLLVPISLLIATLITFGSLEKTNQLVALKACGVSIYHVAVPILLLGILVSGTIFVMQEHVLPVSNQHQENLRNVIKGSPVQTTQPGHRWIFGEGNHLYHYNHFNPERDFFAELSIYELDIGENRLGSHIYAQRASWDRERQQWKLEAGWRRELDRNGFETFEEVWIDLGERPEYFDEEVKATSKMTYSELAEYIETLRQGGFEVDSLQTELYKKFSFPVVSLIMAALGLPFALTLGRKGALSGVGVGILIGIVYWGAFGVFDVLGASGLLAPILAAWAPNLLFGAGAALLLSLVRT